MGFSLIVYANVALQASLMAMQTCLKRLHEQGSITGMEDQLMMFKERQQMVNAQHFNDLAEQYGGRKVN
jgi:2-methylisocitrate lyase-like PEP mutase family enzyme